MRWVKKKYFNIWKFWEKCTVSIFRKRFFVKKWLTSQECSAPECHADTFVMSTELVADKWRYCVKFYLASTDQRRARNCSGFVGACSIHCAVADQLNIVWKDSCVVSTPWRPLSSRMDVEVLMSLAPTQKYDFNAEEQDYNLVITNLTIYTQNQGTCHTFYKDELLVSWQQPEKTANDFVIWLKKI